ncbi:multidrug transporter [Chryseobacterium carnipullorum]|uniref:Multidrug transporter n=2 Tax=Chryseobacterium carnipullorum TaxID=1124835 RepID=A0A1M7L2A2_CHRCU|nr:bestrophin family ion channel [Chryseobacterium carnipullorum]AZA49614.1 multidrug transporter [Chryseobacterium carnipullorum]AZA64508.1 multidrug transporter [Chryseobacterium carnipullorum]MDN5475814.1 multidrug transporter [Chryseobacterium sp.]SHM71884.1 putative membrane protein [Chryseobacterium carnipullorum]
MHSGKRFGALEFAIWTRRSIYILTILSAIPTVLYFSGWKFLSVPWQPIAILGTAVAFIVGFKNNASYSRLWEARQIYGAIINDSRSFGYILRDALYGKDPQKVKEMFHRHYAWLTALRFQLREPRTWENMGTAQYDEYAKKYEIPERLTNLNDELKKYLSDAELQYIVSKKNRATQLMASQSKELSEAYARGDLNDFQWTQINQQLVKFTDDQGKAERIKNFPYPRNFSSITTYLLLLFILFVPFGLLKELDKLGEGTALEGWTLWFNIPFSLMVTWCFHTLDSVGEASVNPFEGSPNDVPITQISRTIEIDMRDMLDESDLPPAIAPKNNIVL